jgi:NDP-sugar pyrophosphorylase family protein
VLGIEYNSMLTPESFFSLDGFAHRELFAEAAYVWEALGRLEAYLKKQKLGKIEVSIPESAYLKNREQISIGKGSSVEPGAYIEGPCVLGENCVVRHGAYIRGNVIAGDGCVIGHATEIKHSILLNTAHAAHFNYVGDSILGNGTNLGAGAKLANYRFDHAEVCVVVDGKKIRTGLKKFGAIVGDGAQIGCNAVTNPGTLLMPKKFIHPCQTVGGLCRQHS